MLLIDALGVVKGNCPDLFEEDADLTEFGISQSFWQGSDSQAQNQNVSEPNICAADRLRNVENARGKHPTFNMCPLNPQFDGGWGSCQESIWDTETRGEFLITSRASLSFLGMKGFNDKVQLGTIPDL
eukprot:10099468-Ditylum_brightwellii.AAC.1